MQVAPYILAAFFAVILGWMYRTHHRKTWDGRAQLLDSCRHLFQEAQLSRSEAGYARLQGMYDGYRIQMTLEEDHLTMRKIPSLWLHVVIEGRRRATTGTLGVLVRPQNTEFYSLSWDWDQAVAPLAGWPEHALYRTQDGTPDLQLIDARVRQLFDDVKTKELIVTPQRVRLTYQAKQADRGEYLLLRAADFNHEPLSPDTVQSLLRHGVGIRQDLEGVPA